MSPFWHPLSVLLLPELRSYASPTMIRMLLAANGKLELRYAGDAMWPAVGHGELVTAEPLSQSPIVPGQVVIACPEGIPELSRVVGRTPRGRLELQGDSDPAERATVAVDAVLARVAGPWRRPSLIRRHVRRLALDLAEAWRRSCDLAQSDLAETVLAKYERQAAGYASCEAEAIHPAVMSRLRERVPPGGRMLVAGSGAGRECFELAQRGWRVRGVDFSPAMVEQARSAARARGLDVSFVNADLREHEEPPGSLDGVLFTPEVYSFLPYPVDRVEVLRRIAGWLDRDGVLLVSARPIERVREYLILTLQWIRGMGRRHWGDSHTRYVLEDGTIHRSFVHYFTQRKLKREIGVAGLKLERLDNGRAEATRARGAPPSQYEEPSASSVAPQMDRPTSPPPMEFFERARHPRGDDGLALDLDRVRIVLRGLDHELARALRGRYGPYVNDAPGEAAGLRVDVAVEETDYFIEPPSRPEFNPVLLKCDGPRVRFVGYRVAGWFDVLDGQGLLLLARGAYEPAERGVENYVRAAVAWQAASRGGALVHAASAVWQGRGYLFYGESGAGKSTLAASNRRARIVSDDLSLVLPDSSGRPELVGSPFRGTYEGGDPVVGHFPLAAGFRLIQDTQASVRETPRARALAELVGNLPFVAESFNDRPDLFREIERTFAGLPLAHLHFCKDDSYWDAIERAGRAR